MQSLIDGIKIHHISTSDPLLKENRIYLSSGTYQPLSLHENSVRYAADAFLPQEPWKALSEVEQHLLVTLEPDLPPGSCVTMFRLPDQAFMELESIGLSHVSTIEELFAFRKHPDYQHAIKSLIAFVNPLFQSTDGLVINPIVANPSDLPVITYDKTTSCYIGLHLDSWDNAPLIERANARNRLCINMGREDRYLLFMNLSLMHMFREIYTDVTPEHFQQTGHLGEIFMRKYPYYPIVKVRIAPHEAYIAPTENIIHDGCTLDQRTIDLVLHIRGNFSNKSFLSLG